MVDQNLGNSQMNIAELINMSLSNDESAIRSSTSALLSIIEDPGSIGQFLELYINEPNPSMQFKYLVYIEKIISKHWKIYSNEQKAALFSQFATMINNSNVSDINRSFAQIYNKMIHITEDRTIFDFAISSQNQEFVFFFIAMTIDELPDHIINANIEKILNLAFWGINQPNLTHFAGAAVILTQMFQYVSDQSVFQPVCQLVVNMLPQENSLSQDVAVHFWMLLTELMEHKLLPLQLMDQALMVLSQSNHAYESIHWFSSLVPMLEENAILNLVNLNVNVLAKKLQEDSTLPEDFDEIISAVIKKCGSSTIKGLIESLLKNNEYHQCIGIYFITPLLRSTTLSTPEECDFVFNCLQTAIKSQSPMFNEASLRVMRDFCDSPTELVSHFPDLIEITLPFIFSNEESICHLAYNALTSVLDECDELEDSLLTNVWNQRNSIIPDMKTSYNSLISTIIQHIESPDDDVIDSILEWLEGIYTQETDITIRSSALLIISSLISKEESYADSLMPECQKTVAEAFSSNNPESISNAFVFLKTVSRDFGSRSVPIISPFVPSLISAINDKSYELEAVVTASIYSGYSKEKGMLDILCQHLLTYLEEDNELNTQISGCSALKVLALALDDSPYALKLYNEVLILITKMTEIDLINEGFEAAKALYKRCRQTNLQQFLELSFMCIDKLLTGDFAYIEGDNPFTTEKMDPILQNEMAYIGTFFKSSPPNADNICLRLVEWIKVTSEKNIFSLIGALTDAIEFCQINESVPIALCSFIATYASSIRDADLQQNVSFFLGLICRRFPQQIPLVQQVMPIVLNWWKRALSKKSGFQEVLSNIASLFLSYANHDSSFSEKLLIEAYQQFPPVDLLETETMCLESISLFSKRQFSNEVIMAAAYGFSKLFTEGASNIEKRKIKPEVLKQSENLFRTLMQNSEVNNSVIKRYSSKKSKQQQLMRLLS